MTVKNLVQSFTGRGIKEKILATKRPTWKIIISEEPEGISGESW